MGAHVGMWIAFAFVAGMVLIGFKSRQLKWYEFIVSGLFLLLLDRLVFHGQISAWVGQIGSKAQGAASHGALIFPFLLTPGGRAKARRFTARLAKHRPTGWDYAFYLLVVIAAHLVLRWGWLVCFGTYALLLAALTVAAALLDREGRIEPARPVTDSAPAHGHGAGRDGEGVGVDG